MHYDLGVLGDRFYGLELKSTTKFSNVYKAICASTGSEMAIKIVSVNQRRLLARELSIQSRLSHPNILRLVDHLSFQNFDCIITPFAKHGTVADLMRKNPTGMDPELARKIFIQMSSAVSYLHQQGIIHKDIKLENFLVIENDNDNLLIVLADFGLSQYATDEEMIFSGTLNYAAPEIITSKQYSFEVDTWALGICLYTMLTGKLPFDACRKVSKEKRACIIRNNIRNCKVSFPAKQWIDLSSERELIQKMLVVDPKGRISLGETQLFLHGAV